MWSSYRLTIYPVPIVSRETRQTRSCCAQTATTITSKLPKERSKSVFTALAVVRCAVETTSIKRCETFRFFHVVSLRFCSLALSYSLLSLVLLSHHFLSVYTGLASVYLLARQFFSARFLLHHEQTIIYCIILSTHIVYSCGI